MYIKRLEKRKTQLNGEMHLFIIWNKARNLEKKILDDLKDNFTILQVQEIKWAKKDFSHNLSQFYGKKLPLGCNKEKEVGRGKFLLVLIADEEPFYVIRRTNSGDCIVNVNVFDSKEMYRNWVGGHKIHSSNTQDEFEHDIFLLLGKHAAEVKAIFESNGHIESYKKRL